MRLEEILGEGRLQYGKSISPYLTMRTVVTAEVFLELRTRDEWLSVIHLLAETSTPYVIFGGGSNVAVLSSELKGIVIRNMYQKREIVADNGDSVDMRISSGYSVTRLAKETAEEGYEGFEYHMGLPGTLGGGIYMNSKWTRPDAYLGDTLVSATVIDRGGHEVTVGTEYFDFSYGYSNLQKTKDIFLEGVFRLKKADPAELIARAKESVRYRAETQPKGQFTTGCFFKNISEEERARIGVPTKSAGYLIDRAGLKLTERGDYYISEKHANFIMNRGTGTPQDLRELVQLVKRTVQEKFGVELREEVIVL
jgi:UDP-N-acetylmuramate dehydrogenase